LDSFNWAKVSHPIRLRREELELSLRELGEASGVHFTRLNRIENGDGVNCRDIPAIAHALLMDQNYLFSAITLYHEMADVAECKADWVQFIDLITVDLEKARELVKSLWGLRPPGIEGDADGDLE
jgi:transcriptional regulator with XRE-family HTH domain